MSLRLRLLLIFSLILNAFLLSAAGALAFSWHRNFGLGLRSGWRMHAADVLPADHARAFRATMRETVMASRPLVREGRLARADAAQLFVQPNYDGAGIKAALARARAADVSLRGRLEDQVVNFASTLPVNERQAMAYALRRGPFRQPQRKAATASDGSSPSTR